MNDELLTFFAWYSGDSKEEILKAWHDWQYKPKYSVPIKVTEEWKDLNCDCSGNCFSDADPDYNQIFQIQY